MVHAIDANLAFAEDSLHDRPHFHDQGMAMIGVGGVEVRQGFGQILGNVQKEIAALRNIEKLHAAADAEHGHPPFGDQPHQHAIEVLSPPVQEADGRVQHETIVPRIEVGSATEDHAVQRVQQAVQIVFFP